jgi:hypothetical protein
MKFGLIWFGMVCVILTGCTPNKIVSWNGETATTQDGKTYCLAEYTSVLFENNDNYVMEEVGWQQLHHINRSERIIFHPAALLYFCPAQRNDTGDCTEISPINVTLPCTYCVEVTTNYSATDEGRSCLSQEENYIIDSIKAKIGVVKP